MNDYAMIFCNVNKTQYAALRKAFNLLVSVGVSTENASALLMDAHIKKLARINEERIDKSRAYPESRYA